MLTAASAACHNRRRRITLEENVAAGAGKAGVRLRLDITFNHLLETLVAPTIKFSERHWSAFQVCGCVGLVLAVALALVLISHHGFSMWVIAVIFLAAVITFLALVMATKIITGEENLIYYHHEIAAMLVSTLVLWILSQPLLPYLDVMILGIGTFLTCGRVGCLMVGCCHGRPYHWGVCYRQEHAIAGFTPYFVGVRLFPIQAVESLWVFFIVLVGVSFILNGHQPGEALAWYVISYDLGRFCFEFARGDPDRPHYWGFSQPQWISVILMITVSWAEWVDILPFHVWHTATTGALILAMVFITLNRRYQKTKKHLLLHPQHVKEIAEAIQMVSRPTAQGIGPKTLNAAPQNIRVAHTSLGIQISAGKISDKTGNVHHFALSSRNEMMTEDSAKIVADLILKLKYPSDSINLSKGNQGVFHLLIQPPRSAMHGLRSV